MPKTIHFNSKIYYNVYMKKILIKLINLYQITPLHCHSACRFTPTCSEYMKQCIQEYGYKGILMGIKRLLRCRPLGSIGYDPVPIKEKE